MYLNRGDKMRMMYEFGDTVECPPCQSFELKDSRHLKRKERCSSFIFPASFDDSNVSKMDAQVESILKGVKGILNLYVTGTAPELLAVTKYCFENKISLVVWHYDEKHNNYYPQTM